MMHKLFILSGILISLTLRQPNSCYYIVDKGIYINLTNSQKIKVKYKEGLEFYFSLKNDSTALIQDIVRHKLKKIKEYKISPSLDTVYAKNYLVVNGKRKLKVDTVVFRKVYSSEP